MQLKYKILKALDVSGFTVFDPVVRLLYGEEPPKQIAAITKYIALPIIFILFCFGVWSWVGPNHKTKSGEVPTPSVVWDSAVINDTIAEREKIKSADFLAEGDDRSARLEEVQASIAEKEPIVAELRANVDALATQWQATVADRIAPIQAKHDELRAANRAKANERKESYNAIAAKVAAKTAEAADLVNALKADSEATAAERADVDVLKAQMDAIRAEKHKPLELARKEADSAADALFFLKTREELLSTRNREVCVADANTSRDEYMAALVAAETERSALSSANRITRQESSIERLEGQQYAPAATIYLYIQRSVFTVFIGFMMATVIGVPVGILCGLNKIFMACMTPIIAVFKPVSPVVWLLIFQIVVGAFFPDPENHPLFNFFAAVPGISHLGVNPALIFSACTVAMCAVWPSLVNTALGVASIDSDHLNVARVLRLGFWERLFKIIIPSALPLVFAGLRISMGVGWMVLIAAEALSSSDGLGKFVWDEYQNGSSLTFANIIFACFVVGIIGFFLDRMMIVLQRLVSFDGQGAAV